MKYITFTYVDSATGIPVSNATPSYSGPKMPEGCNFGFALESLYPTDTPTFYGYTEGETNIPGVFTVISREQYDSALTQEMKARESKGYIPAYLLRQRAQKIGIWEDLTDYLFQFPSLLLMVLTLETGIDPKYPELIAGFNALQVPQEIQDYLLSDPSRGV